MKKTSILLTLCMLVLFSCVKDESTSETIDQENIVKSSNIFNGYGISHNLAMDHIATMSNFNSASLEEIFHFADTYTDAYLDNSCQCNDWQTHEMEMTMIEGMQEDMNNASSILVNMDIIASEDVPLTDMLFTILDNAISYESNSYKSIEEFTAEIESLENFIMSNYIVLYDPIEKTGNYAANMLGACSIAKNSYSYWINAILDSSHPWNYRLTQLNTSNRNNTNSGMIQKDLLGDIWHGIKTVGADAIGFLVGGKCGPVLGPKGRDVSCAAKHAKKKSSGVRR